MKAEGQHRSLAETILYNSNLDLVTYSHHAKRVQVSGYAVDLGTSVDTYHHTGRIF